MRCMQCWVLRLHLQRLENNSATACMRNMRAVQQAGPGAASLQKWGSVPVQGEQQGTPEQHASGAAAAVAAAEASARHAAAAAREVRLLWKGCFERGWWSSTCHCLQWV